jgi:hypothetical protein
MSSCASPLPRNLKLAGDAAGAVITGSPQACAAPVDSTFAAPNQTARAPSASPTGRHASLHLLDYKLRTIRSSYRPLPLIGPGSQNQMKRDFFR